MEKVAVDFELSESCFCISEYGSLFCFSQAALIKNTVVQSELMFALRSGPLVPVC